MKTLLFSLLFIIGVLPNYVFANESAVSQGDVLNYINNPPPLTNSDLQKPPSPALQALIDKVLKKENLDTQENQPQEGETAQHYIDRINITNNIREIYNEAQLPDPTISTTQVPPNNGVITPPYNPQAPPITNPSQWLAPTQTSIPVPTPTNIPLLDQIVPVSTFGSGQPLHNILNQLFYIGLVLAVILAIVMIIRGGLEYMTIDAISSKENGKSRVKAALGGLLLAFSAILILNTINPGLTSLNIVLSPLAPINSVLTGLGITSGVRNPDGTITTSSGQTVNMTADGIIVVNPDGTTFKAGAQDAVTGEFTNGTATNFGYNDSLDNGRGTPTLDPSHGSGILTNRNDIFGVALPESVLRSELGLPASTGENWAAWAPARNAAVLVTNGNQSYIVPIVDLGPGSGPISNGVVMDETYALNKAFGGDGNRSYKIIPNYYTR